MTLVIALSCKDGIVMASDGQATSLSSGGPVKQKYRKIFRLNKHVLLGASGTIGIIQRCRDEISEFIGLLSNKGLNHTLKEEKPDGKLQDIKIRDKIRGLIFSINKDERERHEAFYNTKKQAPLADILLVIRDPKKERFRIWHVAPDGGEELLDELGYGCTGIGDVFAHALLKDYNIKEMDVEKGKPIAYRVIKEAIGIGAFGLGKPIDIWIMKNNQISQLSKKEIMALEDTYQAWKETERGVFKKIYNKK